ncbi:MAG: methyltransferase domain-containing protein [Thiohalocapsa sp.]
MLKEILNRIQLLEPARDVRNAARLGRKRLAWTWKRRFGQVDSRLVRAHLDNSAQGKLHLGAGNHILKGWLNADLYPASADVLHLDARMPFPFPDNTFAFVFSEHMIEHLSYHDGVNMLVECLRVLSPGGRIRISTPDFNFLLNIYRDPTSSLHQDYIAWQLEWINRNDMATAPSIEPIFVVNNFVRDWGHEFIYDPAVLHLALESAGFVNLTACAMNESELPELSALENEGRAPSGFIALETMTLEGTKPARR